MFSSRGREYYNGQYITTFLQKIIRVGGVLLPTSSPAVNGNKFGLILHMNAAVRFIFLCPNDQQHLHNYASVQLKYIIKN